MENIKHSFVTTTDLQQEINIDYIARHGLNTEMPFRSNRVVMRSKKLKSTAIFWKSGKLVCSGGNTEIQAKKIARRFARKAQLLGNPDVEFTKFKVVNIMSSCDLKTQLSLEKMAITNSDILYEPELNPYALYTFNKKIFFIFSTGKIIVHGGYSSSSDIKRSVSLVVKNIVKIKKSKKI